MLLVIMLTVLKYAIAPAIIAAGIAAAGSGAQAVASGKMNKKTLAYNRETRDMSRQWALEDWNMVNEYNSPAAQMQRFKDAGLSENLIYGQQTNADAVARTDMPQWKPETPDIGSIVSKPLTAYMDIRMQDQQMNNLRMMEQNMKADNAIKLIQASNLATAGDTAQFDLAQKRALSETAIKQAMATLEGTLNANQVLLNRDEREQAANASNLQEAAERILKSRQDRAKSKAEISAIGAQINQLRSSTELNRLDADLKRQGIQPGDNIFFRILGRLLSRTGWMDEAADKVEMFLDEKSVK